MSLSFILLSSLATTFVVCVHVLPSRPWRVAIQTLLVGVGHSKGSCWHSEGTPLLGGALPLTFFPALFLVGS